MKNEVSITKDEFLVDGVDIRKEVVGWSYGVRKNPQGGNMMVLGLNRVVRKYESEIVNQDVISDDTGICTYLQEFVNPNIRIEIDGTKMRPEIIRPGQEN